MSEFKVGDKVSINHHDFKSLNIYEVEYIFDDGSILIKSNDCSVGIFKAEYLKLVEEDKNEEFKLAKPGQISVGNITPSPIKPGEDGQFLSNKGWVDKNKEEFKVDKLGYYETRNKLVVKIIHELRVGSSREKFVGIITYNDNYGSEDLFDYSEKGEFDTNGADHDFDLIKYIGPEIPVKKEPRYFEFEATYSEYEGFCFKLEKDQQIEPKLIGPKWRVTMTEILEDK